MSAIEIIEQLKTLPMAEKKAIRAFLDENLAKEEPDLFNDFTLLGSDAEACDVAFAQAAQGEVVHHAG